jgi:hypothetical protein
VIVDRQSGHAVATVVGRAGRWAIAGPARGHVDARSTLAVPAERELPGMVFFRRTPRRMPRRTGPGMPLWIVVDVSNRGRSSGAGHIDTGRVSDTLLHRLCRAHQARQVPGVTRCPAALADHAARDLPMSSWHRGEWKTRSIQARSPGCRAVRAHPERWTRSPRSCRQVPRVAPRRATSWRLTSRTSSSDSSIRSTYRSTSGAYGTARASAARRSTIPRARLRYASIASSRSTTAWSSGESADVRKCVGKPAFARSTNTAESASENRTSRRCRADLRTSITYVMTLPARRPSKEYRKGTASRLRPTRLSLASAANADTARTSLLTGAAFRGLAVTDRTRSMAPCSVGRFTRCVA